MTNFYFWPQIVNFGCKSNSDQFYVFRHELSHTSNISGASTFELDRDKIDFSAADLSISSFWQAIASDKSTSAFEPPINIPNWIHSLDFCLLPSLSYAIHKLNHRISITHHGTNSECLFVVWPNFRPNTFAPFDTVYIQFSLEKLLTVSSSVIFDKISMN